MGKRPIFMKAAHSFGRTLAELGINLIYGGGKVGLMGAVADGVLAVGGKVIGVMPQHLVDREIAHPNLTELVTVSTMHERKTRMSELADAFVALPGGAGTLEEIMEQWTWVQLGLHQKPIAFLNVQGYFDSLFGMIDHMVAQEFLATTFTETLIRATDASSLIDGLKKYQPPARKRYD